MGSQCMNNNAMHKDKAVTRQRTVEQRRQSQKDGRVRTARWLIDTKRHMSRAVGLSRRGRAREIRVAGIICSLFIGYASLDFIAPLTRTDWLQRIALMIISWILTNCT